MVHNENDGPCRPDATSALRIAPGRCGPCTSIPVLWRFNHKGLFRFQLVPPSVLRNPFLMLENIPQRPLKDSSGGWTGVIWDLIRIQGFELKGCSGWFRLRSCFLWRLLPSLVLKRRSLRLVIWKRKSHYLLGRGWRSQPHPGRGKLDHSHGHDELFGDAVCNVVGLPERGQVFFSFLTLCKNWLKNLRSWSPFSVPKRRVNNDQEHRWGPSHAGCSLLTLHFLLPESPVTKENDSCWQFLRESFLICLSSHWQGFYVMLCCVVD